AMLRRCLATTIRTKCDARDCGETTTERRLEPSVLLIWRAEGEYLSLVVRTGSQQDPVELFSRRQAATALRMNEEQQERQRIIPGESHALSGSEARRRRMPRTTRVRPQSEEPGDARGEP